MVSETQGKTNNIVVVQRVFVDSRPNRYTTTYQQDDLPSFAEIARALNVSPQAAWQLHDRAMKKLRVAFGLE